MNSKYIVGMDLGSTTVKLVVINESDDKYKIIYSNYKRHHAQVRETISGLLKEAVSFIGNVPCYVAITGSAGMGLTEQTGLPFVQEVVASANYIKKSHPDVRTFIEIGGEDSKIIFFDDKFRTDMRMNGSCAGGTGAFIDQMAVLLDIPVENLESYAEKGTKLYPIATRCGVFAKTDVQSLLSNNVPKEDIALSTFHAVALQVLSTLTRGKDISSKILLGGGPLTFFPSLRKAFVNTIRENHVDDFIIPENSQLIPAIGTALSYNKNNKEYDLENLIKIIEKKVVMNDRVVDHSLPTLFKNDEEYNEWLNEINSNKVSYLDLEKHDQKECFLGIDSGSTTTKIVLIDNEGSIVDKYYANNKGNSLNAIRNGLKQISETCKKANFTPIIKNTGSTGYGEGLIKSAYNLDLGIVETMAHYRSAREFAPDVSFVLDIGGQDMKAMYISDGYVADILINEACSSGCGSFIETFANNMKYSVQEFADKACNSKVPYDLGTRCTVFMNTKVKQALREGVSIEDISAGLSYSVIKNSLYKVMKIKDADELGSKIVVQGGTFKNNSVLRAFELLTKRKIVRPDIPELMGAYGVALTAMDKYKNNKNIVTKFEGLEIAEKEINISKSNLQCKGCENRCQVVKITFKNGNSFYTGNNCERIFTNNSEKIECADNLISDKRDIYLRRNLKANKPKGITIGIPRILNMFENFPFWSKFFNECGFDVVLSDRSNIEIFEAGIKSVMSENICFPAKLAHGHVLNLIEKKVDRIFFPNVVFEEIEFKNINNSYNCPVVTGYPCVIRSAIDPEDRHNTPLDSPPISFKNIRLLKKQLYKYMKALNVSEKVVSLAIKKAIEEQQITKQKLRTRAKEVIKKAENENIPIIVLAGRPYHIDKLINHGIPELISELGAIVLSEDAIQYEDSMSLSDVKVLTQWTYSNRLYAAAKWVSEHPFAQLIQLNSFGCGPDAVTADEVNDILQPAGKLYTLIKVDEVFNLGAVKIRLRSMIEAVRKKAKNEITNKVNNQNKAEENISLDKTIIVPYFSKYYSPLIPAVFEGSGLKVESLPPQDDSTINYGIKNINNEICYPAVLVAGDIIKAFKTGQYDRKNTMVLLTQTDGQCRASNYVSLVRKALERVGYGDVYVAVLSTNTFNALLPGVNQKEIAKRFALGIVGADCLLQMYLPTRVRESETGAAKILYDKYMSKLSDMIAIASYNKILKLLTQAVIEFNNLKIKDGYFPKIGIVGEIFVKYNSYAHMDIIDWITDQGAEVVLPPIQGFFLQNIVNSNYMHKAYFDRSIIKKIKTKVISMYINWKLKDFEKVMKKFKFYRKSHDLTKLAGRTEQVLSLANQFGEGWLLTADMLSMLEEGIENIISVQPFGCISNHVVSKGIERSIAKIYPNFKLLALDFDQSTSPANVFNRLHFMIASAKEESNEISA